MVEISEEQAAYLRERQVGILATSRKDGSPQQSMITYLFDGEHIVISTVKTSAKHHNVRRQPRVSLLVPDGKQQVIVYGTAEVLGGRERDRYIMAIREHQGDPLPADYDLDRFSLRLDELGRVIIRITLQRVLN
ncbi:MAG: TIGR03618 family F420-dependent PPOX class oxidoreductase [Dehalococcoidia bacterium]